MSLEEFPKKIQYINIDSNFVNGSNNNFSISFENSSNMFIQEMKDVVGFKLTDFYATQVGLLGDGTGTGAKYIDILCNEIPTPAQILDERHGQILARIPLERVSSNVVFHDKQWNNWTRETNFFNPISIKKLSFKMYELRGNGDYVPLQPDTSFYMTFELNTIDHQAKTPDRSFELLQSIDKLCGKLEKFCQKVQIPEEIVKPSQKKIPVKYLVLFLASIIGMYLYFKPAQPAPPVQVPFPPMG